MDMLISEAFSGRDIANCLQLIAYAETKNIKTLASLRDILKLHIEKDNESLSPCQGCTVAQIVVLSCGKKTLNCLVDGKCYAL